MRKSWIFTAVALSLGMAAAQTPDFDGIATTLHEFRRGSAAEISIRFTPSTFKLMRETEAPLAAADGERMTAKFEGLPQLEITRDGHWFAYEISRDVTVIKPADDGDQSSRQWKKRTWNTIASYQRTAWPSFLDFALANGLSSIQSLRFGKEVAYALSFSPVTPETFSSRGRTIALNLDFRENMRFSSEYPPQKGANGFVVLLHDPHQHVAGRYQTLAALRALSVANPAVRFRFLVEGAYEDPDRKIPFNGLDTKVNAAGEARAALVYSLLSRFFINTPLAYRLLYDQGMYAHAIDDNTKLQYPAPPPGRTERDQLTSLSNVFKAVSTANSVSPAEKRHAAEAITEAAIYIRADEREASGDQLVSYYKKLAELSRTVADLAQNVGATDAAPLATDAAYWQWQQMNYQNALDRNRTMVREIVTETRAAGGDLPIAFVGNFHTSGLLPGLQAAGIGYVVIEPRPRVPPSETEDHAFEQANHVDSRGAYLRSIRLNMGFNAPTAVEVRELYTPKIDQKVPELRSTRTAFERELGAIAGSAIVTDRVRSAMDANGSISEVVISSGGNQPPPPANYSTAFAYFDPSEGSKPTLFIADARDRKWSGWERYNFLRNALFFPPPDRPGVTTEASLTFYPEPASSLMFMTIYDPKSKRTYCFEREAKNVVMLLPSPFPQTGDRDARIQLSEIILKGTRANG